MEALQSDLGFTPGEFRLRRIEGAAARNVHAVKKAFLVVNAG